MHTSLQASSGIDQSIGDAGPELPHGLEQAHGALLAAPAGMQESLEGSPGRTFARLAVAAFQAGCQALAFASQAREAGLATTFLGGRQRMAGEGVQRGIKRRQHGG